MIFYFTIIISVTLDIITKHLASIFLLEKINIFGNFIFLKFIENEGIAFGMNIPFIKIITIFLISLIFYYYLKEEKKKKSKLIDISFGLILGGAIGNGIGRVFFGKVTDFFGISFFSIFNLADILITIGVILYFIYLFKSKQ